MLSLKLSTPKSTKGISERLILFCFNLSFRKASRALNKSIFQSVKLKKFIWINCFGYSIIFNKIYYHENNDWIRLGLLICAHRYLYLPQALFKRASNFKSWDYHLNSFIPRSSVSNHIRWVKVEVDCLLSTAKLSFVVKIERRREREGEREREPVILFLCIWSFLHILEFSPLIDFLRSCHILNQDIAEKSNLFQNWYNFKMLITVIIRSSARALIFFWYLKGGRLSRARRLFLKREIECAK